jgi:hypothetical protein
MSEFNHTQSVASTSWTITHNLNVPAVAIDVMVDNGGSLKVAHPLTVEHTNDNTITITFSASNTGRARIVV